MNILFVSSYYKPAFVYGGPVQSIANLCEGLAASGASVSVFTTNANGPTRLDVPVNTPVQMNGVTVTYFPLDFNGLSFFYSSSLSKGLSSRVPEFDIVIAETLWGQALMPLSKICAAKNIPYIISARGQLNAWALAKKNLKKRAYLFFIGRKLINQAKAIYCTDPSEVDSVNKLNFSPPAFFLPNGVNSSEYRQKADTVDFRKQYGIPLDAEVILLLGRITQIKRPDIATDVIAAAQSLNRNIHLLFVGPDEEDWETRMREKARHLNCEGNIHFTGLLDRKGVLAACSSAELLIMPSEIQENFGNSALEAMAAGVPILVSEGIPVGQWAVKYGAGRVVPCTREAFIQAALELLQDPEGLKRMGKSGQEMVQQNFDISAVCQHAIKQYESIIISGKPLNENDLTNLS